MTASDVLRRAASWLAAPVLTVAVLAGGASAAPAQAFADEPADGTFNILTADQTLALAVVDGAADGDKVALVPEDPSDDRQKFMLTECDDGSWEIVSALNSDLSLDVDGTGAQVWSKTGAANQRFAIYSVGNGSVRIVPVSNMLKALTLSDDAVSATGSYDEEAYAAQAAAVDDGSYAVMSADALSVATVSVDEDSDTAESQSFYLRAANLVGMVYTEACVGDKLVYSVTQQVNELGVNSFVRYTSMTMTDTLPDGLTYVSAKLYSEKDVCLASSDGSTKTAGTFSYNSSTRLLTFTFSSSYLSSGMAYEGEKYRMEITTTIAEVPDSNKFENTGYTKINSATLTSNKVTTPIYEPALVQGKTVTNSSVSTQIKDSTGALEVHQGDVLHYVLTVDQTVEGAVQPSTSLTDEIPSQLELVSGSVKLTDGDTASVASSGNVITVTTGRLVYGDRIKVEYDCKVLTADSQTITNTFGKPTIVKNPGPVTYYADGEKCYTDKTNTSLTNIYQIDPAAAEKATRDNCAGLDGWYLDPECTVKYDPAVNGQIPGEYGFNLYSRNKVTLNYAVTTNSYFKVHTDRVFYTDSSMTVKLTSDSQVLPASKTYWYGDVVTFESGAAVYYNDLGARRIDPAKGAYRYADGSGQLLTSAKLTANATAYLLWGGSTYDGVYSSS